jgi:hypothetical protein
MSNFLAKFYLFTSLVLLGLIGLSQNTSFAQENPSNVDLGIRILSVPDSVKINGIFGLVAEVYLDPNSTDLPAGETVEATVNLLDPDGIIIDSAAKTWNGFNSQTNGALLEPTNNILFQIPWSQGTKWSPTARWTLSLNLSVSSVESSVENNVVTKELIVEMPNLVLEIDSVTATDPISGQESLEFVPNTNYTVMGSVTNTGNVMTQPGVFMEVVAELVRSGGGLPIDSESVLFPPNYLETNYLPADGVWNFTISNLFMPPDASGDYIIRVRVNPQDIDAGPVMQEESFADNNSSSALISINSASQADTSAAELSFVEGSYVGEQGNFRGLEPIFISFAVRNVGKSPVIASDNIRATVYLSKDLETDDDDFILREFNLGGSGIGNGLLAGETINLTWFQQLPDNYEGDFYLLIEISIDNQPIIFPMDSSPLITLESENKGVTTKIQSDVANGSFAERPSASKSGRFVVFEKSVRSPSGQNFQQIYLKDMLVPLDNPRLISKSFNDNTAGGNGDSFRPRMSQDGSTIVFHSSATDLVPGDTNNKEDVFLYRVSTNTIFRAVNANNDQLNGRSLYPDVNGDGSVVVFESDATNADLNNSSISGKQIYLWTINASGGSSVMALTGGDGSSQNPSIDESGNRIAFDSYATNLLDNNTSGLENGSNNGGNLNFSSDANNLRDVFMVDLEKSKIYLSSINYLTQQTEEGESFNARISGNGERIVFESKSQNLVSGTGIAKVVVTQGGAGYAGNPTVEITDADFNASGAPGSLAVLSIKDDGINALNEINSDAVQVIDPGYGYVDPQVRIIPDPNFPEPEQEAIVIAYLSNPNGDAYYVDVQDINGSNNTPNFAQRISQSDGGTGGDAASRDLSISWDGNSIVYSTKSSNLLPGSVTRADGKQFLNASYILPTAKSMLVGGIGEIEINASGVGYSPGYLRIEDLSGLGSGALASYQVDSRGRIVKIDITNQGENYHLESTVISVALPNGGSGFEAGQLRFPQVIGEGINRIGGGRIHKVEMSEYGYGYRLGSDTNASFADIIQFEGDGADLNEDGFPDGKMDPSRVKNLNGSLYIEQKFDIEFLSIGADLLNTQLTIYDKNNSLNPIIIDFEDGSGNTATTINTNGLTLAEIRDELINLIAINFGVQAGNTDVTIAPVIDQNQTNSSTFTFSALSGRFYTSNPAAIRITEQSNMLIKGSGYTTATPIINQVPSIYGFSEIKNNPEFQLKDGVGRTALLSTPDDESDDIYLYDVNTSTNTRISTSSFGTPAGYLSHDDTSTPLSNRFPAISGNGRFVYFSSDAYGI